MNSLFRNCIVGHVRGIIIFSARHTDGNIQMEFLMHWQYRRAAIGCPEYCMSQSRCCAYCCIQISNHEGGKPLTKSAVYGDAYFRYYLPSNFVVQHYVKYYYTFYVTLVFHT